jgi:hypothetical protein
MNLENLANKLNKMFRMLDEVYCINCGGCCYVAYCIATLLHQSNIDYSLAVFEDDEENFEEVDGVTELAESHSHYGIVIEDKYELNMPDDEIGNAMLLDYNPDPDDIMEHYQSTGWNEMYNSDKNEFIKGIITTFYKEFTNGN